MKNTQSKKKSLISQLFSKKSETLPDYSEYLKVKIINDTDTTISSTLGITDERKNELYDIVKNLTFETENITEMLVKASELAKHPNELSFVSFLIGYRLAKESGDPFRGIIGAIIRGTQHGED